MSDKREIARNATILAYRHRVIGHVALRGQAKMFNKPKLVTDTDFPFQAVADACPVPEIGGDLSQHLDAWKTLYRNFQKAWQEHNNETPVEVF